MNPLNSELIQKIRQQFDQLPYPNVPLERSPRDKPGSLYFHNLVTSYYLRNQKVISSEGKLILDAGCGSGYKSLMLAEANPGATIIGVDISEKSVELARQRLVYQGFNQAEFYAMPLEELPSLGKAFDYINCDEVLYLLPDLRAGLQAMQAVLKPEGILRANLHSGVQRQIFLRAQEFFQKVGVMDNTSQEMAIQLVRETMRNLKDTVFLKTMAWRPEFEASDELILANHLLQGDQGYSIPEVFSALKSANLEFISMLRWQQWDLTDLFQDIDELPIEIAMRLGEMSLEEQLHIHELLHSGERLIDFWCGHPQAGEAWKPVSEWEEADWRTVQVHLHPQLRSPELEAELITCITRTKGFDLNRFLPIAREASIWVDSAVALCLLPLVKQSYSMAELTERWQKLRPVHPITLEPTTPSEAFAVIQPMLEILARIGYILLERL